MIPRAHHPLPADVEADLRRAERLCWLSILMLSGVAALMFAAMGDSQAMKTAWIEDMLSLVPPIAFLVAARAARRPPDADYVNGRWRAFDINFLIAAVALAGVGVGLVYDGLHALLKAEHTTIGAVDVAGVRLWHGWLMVGALLVSALPPVLLGHAKLKLARRLQLKPLHTDADMNKAHWMTALAGIGGIVGIGFGLWWADAVAALVIAGSVLKDGAGNLVHAMRDLQDGRIETLERGDPDPLATKVRRAVAALDWVQACDVRLHEEGMRVSGVVVVTPVDDRNLRARLREAADIARAVHWRMDCVSVELGEAGARGEG